MNQKKAKLLRKYARSKTVGKEEVICFTGQNQERRLSKGCTRGIYKSLKKNV